MSKRWIAVGTVSLLLANCAGSGLPGPFGEPEAPKTTMAGRWMLSAPNAPMCGMAFFQNTSADSGTIVPEGGCPGNFYTSRRWAFEPGGLSIKNENDELMAQLTFTGGGFQGQSTAGTAISLARPTIPTAR